MYLCNEKNVATEEEVSGKERDKKILEPQQFFPLGKHTFLKGL